MSEQKIKKRLTISATRRDWGALLFDLSGAKPGSIVRILISHENGGVLRKLEIELPSQKAEPRWILYFPPIVNSKRKTFILDMESSHEIELTEDHGHPYQIVSINTGEAIPADFEAARCDKSGIAPYGGRFDDRLNPFRVKTGGSKKLSGLAPSWEQSSLARPRVVSRTGSPRLCLLLPSLLQKDFSGGPNTGLVIAALLARRGVRVDIISTSSGKDKDKVIESHLAQLLPGQCSGLPIKYFAGHGSNYSFVGENDLIMATAWWTARRAQAILPKTRRDRFLYLIQDYEPLLYAWSARHSMALETYKYDYVPIINSTTLAEYFFSKRPGRFKELCFRDSAHIFEPVIDRQKFYPLLQAPETKSGNKKTLLFYARPSAPRNLFKMGLAAIESVIGSKIISSEEWEVKLIGDTIEPIDIGNGFTLASIPWMGFEAYCKTVRESSVGLSLMLSPHPSYPPLEMAASGLKVVTTIYENKRADNLTSLSGNIIPVEADEVSIAEGLIEAIRHSYTLTGAGGRLQNSCSLPASWERELEPIITFIENYLHSGAPPDISVGKPTTKLDQESYALFKHNHLARHSKTCSLDKEPCLLSIVTSAYNTDPAFLHELADCLLKRNDYNDFEWVLLDNGSDSSKTVKALTKISEHPKVRFSRVEENLGIIGGMRYLLERAKGRYYLPTDSDDIVSDNGLRIMAWHIKNGGFPPLLFSDEDILVRGAFLPGYMKPGWDPVLFLHSCYIAHWCAIDREKALALGAYSDIGSEGCHDWDTFLRFTEAGHNPAHVPVTLYSWRVHSQSAAGGNFDSKSYLFDSHEHTLNRHLATLPCADKFELVRSPALPNTPDWYFRRSKKNAPQMLTLLIRDGALPTNGSDVHPVAGYPVNNVLPINIDTPIKQLRHMVEQSVETGGLVHFLSDQVTPIGDDWPWEAISMMELFPETAMVGGRIYSNHNKLIAGGEYFGFGGDCHCPDMGRPKAHPGYQAQLLKQHSVSAVSTMFSVVDASLLLRALAAMPEPAPISLPFLGAWLGAALRRMGKRIVYSPFMEGKGAFSWAGLVTSEERRAFAKLNGDLIATETLYHPELNLSKGYPYQFATMDRNRVFREMTIAQSDRSTKDLDRLYLAQFTDPGDWTRARVAARKGIYKISEKKTTFSVNTTVYNTPPHYIEALQMSLMAQDYPHFEWNILDNGSTYPEVIKTIKRIGESDRRFRLFRVEDNAHIIGGNRYLLEKSQNQYIAPVDSDDLLHPDALGIMACFIERHKQPPFLYSDEEKFAHDGGGSEPILRTGFAPLTAYAYCYTAHLSCFKREEASRLNVYADSYADGSHDWDTFFRFIESGVVPIHIPEVLYSWRSSPTSTASSISTKDFALTSQKNVLQASLRRRTLDKLFTIEPTEAIGRIWSYSRKKTHPNDVEIIYHSHTDGKKGRDNFEKLCHMIQKCKYPAESLNLTVLNRMDVDSPQAKSPVPYAELKRRDHDEARALNDAMSKLKADICIIIDDTVAPESENWLWDILGLFELDPKIMLASGKIISPKNKILASPRVAGLAGHFAMPYVGQDNFGAMHTGLHILNCTAIAMPWVAIKRKEFLGLGGFQEPISGSGFGDIEASLKVIRSGMRVGFNGNIVFRSVMEEIDYGPDLSDERVIELIKDNADLIMDDPYYHPACSLRPAEFGLICSAERRDYMLSRFLKLPINRWTESAVKKTTTRYDFSSRLNRSTFTSALY